MLRLLPFRFVAIWEKEVEANLRERLRGANVGISHNPRLTDEFFMDSSARPSEPIQLTTIGVVHSPYANAEDAPRQGAHSETESTIEVFEPFAPALEASGQSTHLIILYWAHLASRDTLRTVTPWGPDPKGVFACRSPSRPNPISFCVVRLLDRTGNKLRVRGLDALDGSPVLDIKPYVSMIDGAPDSTVEWLKPGDHSSMLDPRHIPRRLHNHRPYNPVPDKDD